MRLNLRRFDFILLVATLILIVYGVAMVYSATLGVDGYEQYPMRQIIYALIGLVLMVLIAAFDYRLLTSFQWPAYILILVALGTVTLIGQVRGGAAGWFDAGVIFIQPAEISKVVFAVVFAQYLATHHDDLGKPQWVLGALALIGLPVVLVYTQPDLGNAIVLLVIGAVMLFVADIPWGYIIGAVAGAALVVPVIYANLEGYMRDRIMVFFDPAKDPDGYFNVAQALISIGNGGVLGQGFTQGSQSQLHFLRVRYADFIFSVIAEELGFVGAFVLIALLLVVLWRLITIADQARDEFGRLLVTGIITLVMFQIAVSIGMNLGLLPVTGITLPFISYGGSSMLTLLIGIGLAESVAMRNRKIEFD